MNRTEFIGLFTALDELVKQGNVDAIGRVVNAVLEEARAENKERRQRKPWKVSSEEAQ